MRLTSTSPPANDGLTLIEIIGVLAVISILAAVAFPAIVRQVDRANATKESAQLTAMADALSRSVVRTKTLPAVNGMTTAIAAEASLAQSQVTTTACGTGRVFLIDPALTLGMALPYMQSGNNGLPVPPSNARVL